MNPNTEPTSPVAAVTGSSKRLNLWANRRCHHHPNVVCIDTPPSEFVDLKDVCEALLVGLGKDTQLWQGKSSTVTLARAWLSLGETTDAIIVDAQLLRPRLLDEIIELLAGHGVRAWLLISGNHPAHLETITARDGCIIAEAELREAFPDSAKKRTKPATPTIRLPRVQGFVFRSACRDLLMDDEFAEVDTRFCDLVKAIRAELANVDGHAKSAQVARLLRNRMIETGDTEQLLLVVCAAQVAAVPYRFLIGAHLPTLLGAAETVPRVGRAVPERWWEQLDSYREASVGAIAALYHSGIDPDAIRFVSRHDVTPRDSDGNVTVTVNGVTHTIGGVPARFIEAQRIHRELATAGDAEYLFSTHRPGKVGIRHINKQLLVPGAELGVEIADQPVRKYQREPAQWLQRYGIRVERAEWSTPTKRSAS